MTIHVLLNLNEVGNFSGRFYSAETIEETIANIPEEGLFVEGNDSNENSSGVAFELITHRATGFFIENNQLKATVKSITGSLLEAHPDGEMMTCGTGDVDKETGAVSNYRLTKLYFQPPPTDIALSASPIPSIKSRL